jgi:molecular chaperone GrpE
MSDDTTDPGRNDASLDATSTNDGGEGGETGTTGETGAAQSDEDVEVLRAERDQWRDAAVRLQADFENYRKRAAGQASDEADRAAGRIVEQLLPVLDACEAALAHGVTGVDAVWTPLLDALQKQGLDRLDVAGQPYDPALAEAVVHDPGDGDDVGGPVVAEVLRTGWRWKGRVLRAAMVRVKG